MIRNPHQVLLGW